MIPTVSFDFSYFVELGQLPFTTLLLRVFLDGGWLFVVYFIFAIGWHFWVDWRQELFEHSTSYTVLAIDVPQLNEQTPKAVEQIFTQLAGTYKNLDFRDKYWYGKFQQKISFELVSIDGYVQFLVRCPVRFRDIVEAGFYAQYPEAEIIEVADYTDAIPHHYPDPDWDMFGTEFVLKKDSAYPIKTYTAFEHNLSGEFYFKDPIGPFLESLAQLKKGEQLWLQFLLTPIDDSWRSQADPIIAKLTGRPAPAHKPNILLQILYLPFTLLEALGIFGGHHEEKPADKDKILRITPGEKNLLEQIENKVSKICFGTKIRLVYAGKRNVFNKGRFASVNGAFNQFGSSLMNGFRPYSPVTPKTDYFWQAWHAPEKQTHLVKYYKHRSGKGAPQFILSAEELATLYHFPYKQVKSPGLKKTEAKRAEPPTALPTDEAYESPFKKPVPKDAHGAGHGGGHNKAHDTAHGKDKGHAESAHNEPPPPTVTEEDPEEFTPPNLPS